MRSYIKLTDTLIQLGYTRRDALVMPIWEIQEIIKIRNEQNEEGNGHILKI
jgi:hypothetical protein